MSTGARARRWHGLATDLLVVAILVVLCLLFFWQVLTPDPADRRWFASGDFTDQFYAFRSFMADELWSGRLPLWNPFTFSGAPFLADIQSAVYYPIGLLVALLAGKGGLPLIAVEIEVILHFFLASFFVYLFVKHLTGSRLAGLASGIIYAYGSYLTSYPKLQMAILEGQTWVPLALLVIHLAAEEEARGRPRRSAGWLALAGIALGFSALAGHAQTFLLAIYTVLGYLVFVFFPIWRGADRQGKVRLVVRGLILPLVALGLASAQLLPSYEYMQLSTRAQLSYNRAGGGFLFSDLLALVLPGLRVIYVGILPLVLAILGLVLKRRRETIFWGFVAFLALLLSLGRRTFLYAILYYLAPGFNLFQGQERSLQIFSLAVAILAGYGTAILARPMNHVAKHRYAAICRLLRWAIVGTVLLAIFAYWGTALNPPEPGQVNDLLERSVLLILLLGLSTVALHLRLNRKLRGWRLGLLIIPIIVFDLFSLNMGQDLQRGRARDRFEPTPVVQFLQDQSPPFRVWQEGHLPGNFGTVWRLEHTGGISPLRLERYERLLQVLPDEKARWLLNVEYVLTKDESLPDGELIEEYTDPEEDLYLFRIKEPGSPAYVVYSFQVEADDAAALQRLASADFDPSQEVILAESPVYTPPGSGNGVVQSVERFPNRLVLDAETDQDGILVLSEIDYPGWQAKVDGQEVPILRANTILRAIPLEAGRHRVEMSFHPWTVVVGLILSLLTLVVVLAAFPWLRKRQK
ncbi:MAG TPA: YfhO family protein [Anaerolineae bacterium]|nr:YfhO family protein [Anaerolineae bacterium]